jgi:hypothetical protein
MQVFFSMRVTSVVIRSSLHARSFATRTNGAPATRRNETLERRPMRVSAREIREPVRATRQWRA